MRGAGGKFSKRWGIRRAEVGGQEKRTRRRTTGTESSYGWPPVGRYRRLLLAVLLAVLLLLELERRLIMVLIILAVAMLA